MPSESCNVSQMSILNNLSLLFVPAGVGVMAHFRLFGADAIPLSVALLISTVLTIIVTASVMTLINRRTLNSEPVVWVDYLCIHRSPDFACRADHSGLEENANIVIYYFCFDVSPQPESS